MIVTIALYLHSVLPRCADVVVIWDIDANVEDTLEACVVVSHS